MLNIFYYEIMIVLIFIDDNKKKEETKHKKKQIIRERDAFKCVYTRVQGLFLVVYARVCVAYWFMCIVLLLVSVGFEFGCFVFFFE